MHIDFPPIGLAVMLILWVGELKRLYERTVACPGDTLHYLTRGCGSFVFCLTVNINTWINWWWSLGTKTNSCSVILPTMVPSTRVRISWDTCEYRFWVPVQFVNEHGIYFHLILIEFCLLMGYFIYGMFRYNPSIIRKKCQICFEGWPREED